jgi:hypothetical protein
MEILNDFLAPLIKSDARSALYYLSRFLKQAAFFKNYRKDIFEDDARSAPSAEVRSVTLEMIQMIETSEGIAAKDFDETTYSRWASLVRDLEKQLDPELTEDDLARVREFSSNLDLPSPKP